MEVVFSLVGISIVLVLGIAIVFIWAIRSGQFEDMEGPAWRVVMDDDRTTAQITRERESLKPDEDLPTDAAQPQGETAEPSAEQVEPHAVCAAPEIASRRSRNRTDNSTNT